MGKRQAAEELIEDLGQAQPGPATTEELVRASDELKLAAEPNTPAPVAPKAKPFVFDQVSGVLTITDQHGTFETSLQGINPRVEWVLAAHGLASLLKGRVDKERVLENIRAGQFGGKKRRKYPLTVIAYANYQNITIDESWAMWQKLSVADRMQIKSMPKVRLELAKLADAAESK